MPEMLFKNAKYSNWKESHNFENCKLSRKEYGEFLGSYITGENDGFVLNLNGSWGSGKTEFLKRMYTDLLSKKHPCIYIDAWESDFSKDPLTVVTSELLNQLKLFNSDINGEEASKKLSKLFTRVLKGTAVGAAGGIAKCLIGDATIGASTVQQWLNDDSTNYMDFLTKEHEEQIEAISEIRENLTSLANVLESSYSIKLPIVVLIDELDRCRPTYAIEMLEVIKHFFKTINFVFIIATDTIQLSHSINAVYGEKFDSTQYLKRFFDRKATLPSPDIETYLSVQKIDYTQYSQLNLFPTMHNCNQIDQSINRTISLLSRAYDLHIRDIDQLTNKFQSCLRSALHTFEATQKKQYINFPALLIGLIENDKYPIFYNQRTKFYSPDIEIKQSKFKISDDFLLKDFIKASMDNITFVEITNEDYGRHYKEIKLKISNDYGAGMDRSSSPELMKFIDNSRHNSLNISNEKVDIGTGMT